MKLPRIRVDEPITEGFLNKLVDAANAAGLTVGQGGSLNLTDSPDGYVLDAVLSEPIWVKITSVASGSSYNFVEQFPGTGGTWTDGTLEDVAWEANGVTTVAVGTIALAEQNDQGEWVFEAGECT